MIPYHLSRYLARILFAVPLILCLLMFSDQIVFAKDSASSTEHFTLNGSFEGKFYLSSNKNHLFYLENMIPGDSWTGEIHIQNKAPNAMTVSLDSITSNLANAALFDTLMLHISHDGQQLYYGSYGSTPRPIMEHQKVEAGDTLTLDVEVFLPASVKNNFQGQKMDSSWIFDARYADPSTKPATGSQLITGTSSNIFMLWVALFGVIAVFLVVLRIIAAKKAREDEGGRDR